MDHRCGQPGAVAAIFFIDMLNHFFATFVFEIDVNIGRLAAGLGYETFEHHLGDAGRHLGHPQRIADHRICRRAAALAQDPPAAGKADNIVHSQEIGSEAQLVDQAQFLGDLGFCVGINPVREPACQTFGGQPFQPRLCGFILTGLMRVVIRQLVEREGAAGGNLQRAAQRGGVVAKHPRHVCRRFQPPFRIGQRPTAQGVNRAALAQAGQHIGQGAAGTVMHQHIAHRHQWQRRRPRQRR
ncbi:MAG: hypothetical protein ACD_54C01271G0001, partial [uncultured bacterium]